MSLDRHFVTRNDFPMSRRGYDRIAVDRHLDDLARQIEALERPSVGATASSHVQSILDAAEASAAEIERRAWEEATRLQQAADQAVAGAREQVGALGEASRALRERIDALVAEVEALEGVLGTPQQPAQLALGEEPQDTMAFDPLLEDEVEPEATDERDGRFAPDPQEQQADGRTGWFEQGPPAWTS